MNFFTKEWYYAMQDIESNKERVERAFEEYRRCETAQFEKISPVWLRKFQFHDKRVQTACPTDGGYVITFEREGKPDGDVGEILFKAAVVKHEEQALAGAWWLYEEVYKTAVGYEIHILFDRQGLFECVFECEDVVLR